MCIPFVCDVAVRQVVSQQTGATQRNLIDLVASSLRVQIVAWMPQNDILAHPHLRAFLSHVGLNSMYEVCHRQGAWPASGHQVAA